MSKRCPECGGPCEFEPGHPGSWDEPPQPDAWFCHDCGTEFQYDFYDRLTDQAEAKRDAGSIFDD